VWRTDVVLDNFGPEPVTATVTLLPQGTDNTDRSRATTVTVPAGGAMEIADALQALWGFTGVAALEIDAPVDTLAVRPRTFNQSSDGTFGQMIPGFASGSVVREVPAYLLGLSGTDGRRTNVGWVNAGPDPLTVTVALHGAAGDLLGEASFTVLPYGQAQINDVFAALGAPARDAAWAVVTADGPFVPYASVVAAGSNDPIFVAPLTPFDRAARALIPAVVHADGVNGTAWRTDLWLFNPSDETVTARLALLLKDRENPSPETATVTLEPGTQLALDDVVLSVFGHDTAVGALEIETDGGAVLATSRSYNAVPGGSFGQFIPARPAASLARDGEPYLLPGLTWNGAFRTNIGLVALDSSGTVDLVLRDASGSVTAEASVTLGLAEQRQRSLADLFGVASVAGATVEVVFHPAEEGGVLAAYASVIDNVSGDPVYGEALPAFTGTPDTDTLARAVAMTTTALSESVDNSGPATIGHKSAQIDCIQADHEGDSLRPDEDADGKCWRTQVDLDNCGYTFEAAGWGFELDGNALADVCVGVDGYPSRMTSDFALRYTDLVAGEVWDYRYTGDHTLVVAYTGGMPDHATLQGASRLELPSIDGPGTDVFLLESDLTWEGRLSNYVFIPEGVSSFTFPYETEVSETGRVTRSSTGARGSSCRWRWGTTRRRSRSTS